MEQEGASVMGLGRREKRLAPVPTTLLPSAALGVCRHPVSPERGTTPSRPLPPSPSHSRDTLPLPGPNPRGRTPPRSVRLTPPSVPEVTLSLYAPDSGPHRLPFPPASSSPLSPLTAPPPSCHLPILPRRRGETALGIYEHR